MPQSRKEIQERYYLKNKELILERGNEWRRNNPNNVKNIKLKSRYNITLEDYNNAFVYQKGLCAICGMSEKLFVDHSHTTGLVRGLLCFKCNSGLGSFEDDIKRLEKSIDYLKTKVIYD